MTVKVKTRTPIGMLQERREIMRARGSFGLECEVVEHFRNKIDEPGNAFGIRKMGLEFNYVSGRTDIVGENSEGDLLAFEAKLHKWRDALNQAYRNSSFANYSYVVLPQEVSCKAAREKHEFDRRGVGLCSINYSGITIEIEAPWRKPLQPWITESALRHIYRGEGDHGNEA